MGKLKEDALIRYDDYKEAELGIGQRCSFDDVMVYDYHALIVCIMKKDNMTYSEAVEWIEYNILGGYLGKRTPIVVEIMTSEQIDEYIMEITDSE